MLNKVFLLGNLGQDPEVKRLDYGREISNFSLATTSRWLDGETWKESTQWHKVSAFDRLAVTCNANLRKGSKVLVEGTLKYNKVEDRIYTNIVANKVIFLDNKEESGARHKEAKFDENGLSFEKDDIPF